MKTGLRVIEEQLETLKASGVYSEERVLRFHKVAN